MNEKTIVINQIKNISTYFYKYETLINIAYNKNCKENKIGEIIKFGKKDYFKVFTELRNTNNYHVLLNDDSLICFYYEFDENSTSKSIVFTIFHHRQKILCYTIKIIHQ